MIILLSSFEGLRSVYSLSILSISILLMFYSVSLGLLILSRRLY